MPAPRTVASSLALAAALVAGCGGADTPRRPVSGSVSHQGVPLAAGAVRFDPIAPTTGSVGGAVVTAGAYTVPAEFGLLPGRYRVSVTCPVPPTGDGPPGAVRFAKERLPEKYNRKTTLTAEVTAAGPNVFDFRLD